MVGYGLLYLPPGEPSLTDQYARAVMDGLTAVRKLRVIEAEEGLKRNLVIALTGNAREEQKQNAIDSGMDAVVIKPYSAQQLLDKMESMTAVFQGEMNDDMEEVSK